MYKKWQRRRKISFFQKKPRYLKFKNVFKRFISPKFKYKKKYKKSVLNSFHKNPNRTKQ